MTNELETLYSHINFQGMEAILHHQEKIDPVLNNPAQYKRLGLTLLIHIRGEITGKLRLLIEEIRRIEPQQYFYPESDFHVTILDLISANENFIQDNLLITQSSKLVQNTVNGLAPFNINFRGIIPSNEAILVKGYYREGLQKLRNRMRELAHQQNIDLKERYQSISAHSTIVRFKSKLQNREKLLALLQEYQDFLIGEFQVNELELVIHDWYNHRRQEIEKYRLNK
jgi:2'-5' RNA ligase